MSTVVELKKLAKARGLSGYSKLKKHELVAMLGVAAPKDRKNCNRVIKFAVEPFLYEEGSGGVLRDRDLSRDMLTHIKKVVASEYKYLDEGRGNVKVNITTRRDDIHGTKLVVSVCGQNISLEDVELIDDDGNHPYTYMGKKYQVVVKNLGLIPSSRA